ncbi:MAG: hypothetical protein RLZZ47_129 [Bacteroidota bacterium]|jgi:hypothetical protein
MKKQQLFICLALGLSGFAKAQTGFEFNNRHLSQSANINPAFLPQYKLTLGVGNAFEAYHPGFNINTFFNSAADATTTIRNIINDPKVNLGVSFDNRTEMFQFGFKSKRSYFTFNSSNQTLGQINIPKDALGMAMFGNQEYFGKRANFDLSGTEFMSYFENKISYGRAISNKLNVGISYSSIIGIAHANLKTAYAYLETDTNNTTIYQMKMGGAFDAQTSLMGLSVMKALNDSNYDAQSAIEDAFLSNPSSSNRGNALGFGFVYRANKKIQISGAMSNIGKITWNVGAESHQMSDKPWTFTGLDTNITNDLKNVTVQDLLLDSFAQAFDNHSTQLASYETKLHSRYTLGLEYFLSPRTYFQFVYGGGYGVKGDKSFTSINAHKELGEWVDLRLSYTLYDFSNAQHNLGVGMSMNLGPIQPWISLNNVSGLMAYDKSHYQSIRVGLNINIGQRKDTDGDGVRDKSDSCYKTYGARSNNGCELGYLGGKMNYDETEVDSVMAEPIVAPSAMETPQNDGAQNSKESPVLTEAQNTAAITATETPEMSKESTEATPPKTSKKTKVAKTKKKSKSDISLTEAMMN